MKFLSMILAAVLLALVAAPSYAGRLFRRAAAVQVNIGTGRAPISPARTFGRGFFRDGRFFDRGFTYNRGFFGSYGVSIPVPVPVPADPGVGVSTSTTTLTGPLSGAYAAPPPPAPPRAAYGDPGADPGIAARLARLEAALASSSYASYGAGGGVGYSQTTTTYSYAPAAYSLGSYGFSYSPFAFFRGSYGYGGFGGNRFFFRGGSFRRR